MASSTSFSCEIYKGYILKICVDALASTLLRGCFTLSKKGVFLREMDSNSTVMFDISYPRENFRNYKCGKSQTISLNLKHFQKLLRNVKKKDNIILFIDKEKPGQLGIYIRPEGVRKGAPSRFETNYIVYKEEKGYKRLKMPKYEYSLPMVIDSTDFQKIKRFTTGGKLITIKIQGSHYIMFRSDAGEVYSSELGFGELVSEDPDSDEEEDEPEEDEEEDDEEREEGVDSREIYESQFYSTTISTLIKLPGLTSALQFYAPIGKARIPLKVRMNASQGNSTLGTVQVFIKNVDVIAYEATLRDTTPVLTKPKKVRKK